MDNCITCKICFLEIDKDKIVEHEQICFDQQISLLSQKNKKVVMDLQLTDVQLKALAFCHKKSSIYSKSVKPNLFAKMIKMGYCKEDFNKTLKFVNKNVPVIIHFNLDKLIDFMLKDDHYRNLFETNVSSGSRSFSSRDAWENNLFNSIYSNSEVTPYDRVKYGAININCNHKGVTSAYGYGNSYFIMKNDIKSRTTFVYGDSSKQDYHISNFKNFCNILYYIPDKWLQNVINIATNRDSDNKSSNLPTMEYIEAQIHGPVRFDRDIEMIVVNDTYKNNHVLINKLNQFKDKYDVPWTFMGNEC